MFHSANFNEFGAGRDRQARLLREAERDQITRFATSAQPRGGRLAWRTIANRRFTSNASRIEWEAWQTMYCRLIELVACSGFQVEAETVLGQWVAEQRRAHGVGALGKRHRRLLEALPGWTWTARAPARAR
jgi:hypothetical protein